MDNKDLFSSRLKALGIDRQVGAATKVAAAQASLEKIFGNRCRDNVRVVSYNKGVLKVATTSGAWTLEVRKVEDNVKKEVGSVSRIVYGYWTE